jgi:integrase
MSRKSKGARLALDARGNWVIRDGQTKRGTGCNERDRAGAEARLAEYILKKHDPAKAIRQGDPNSAKIADVLTLEMQRLAKADMPVWRRRELIVVCQNMANLFAKIGAHRVGDLNGEIQERYAVERMYQAAAWRDLKILSAAINRFLKRKVGGVQMRFSAVLPDAPLPRERWLTRQEAAKLIRIAWSMEREGTGERQWRHIARFILVGLYTGSRANDIANASLMPTVHKGYVDLDKGIFRRKPANKVETSKRQPTTPLPPRLLAHMRRWQRLGISRNAIIEYRGKPISRVREGWGSVVEAAGLGTDDPRNKVVIHTLRHTSISWYLASGVDIELVSQFTGVSTSTIRKVYRHALPGTFKPVLGAAHCFGR